MPLNSARTLIREENLTKISLGRRLVKRVSLFSDLFLYGKVFGKRGIINVNTSVEIGKVTTQSVADEHRSRGKGKQNVFTIKLGSKHATFMAPTKESRDAWIKCINEAKENAEDDSPSKFRRSTYDAKLLDNSIGQVNNSSPRPLSPTSTG